MAIHSCELSLAADRRELELRGTPMFPCAAYRVTLGHNTPSLPWHWHEELEVLVIRRGSLHIKLSGVDFQLRQNEGAFINSNILHSAQFIGTIDCELTSLVFHPSVLGGFSDNIFEARYLRPLIACRELPGLAFQASLEWQRQAADCIRRAYEACASEEFGHELIVRNRLSELCHLIVSKQQALLERQPSPESPEAQRIKAMLDFLHRHYAEVLELPQIAAAASISERECLRCFKRTVGLAPIQYLLKHRIAVAARRLRESAAPITEISSQTGFDSPSYFAKTFKRLIGVTPSAYRKQQAENMNPESDA